jgi:hypothetical protein|nr:MAG TPA: Protein of unknown function (DUF1642) [Caudoviricetes sp.]DAX43503.1 MAG TPA: Protein of unknown function (DUF1642) [Caudoviricetes sp.]
MNKQELIEKYVYMKRNLETWVCIPDILKDLKQLDEPQKVKIPKFVAECIEYAQASDWDLEEVFQSIANELDTSEISVWFYSKSENMDTLASAWLYGYEIEKKRYLVKIIGITDYNSYLNYHKEENKWTIESSMDTDTIRTKHTRKELEKSGFGWVFNCPGIEVKEVEE